MRLKKASPTYAMLLSLLFHVRLEYLTFLTSAQFTEMHSTTNLQNHFKADRIKTSVPDGGTILFCFPFFKQSFWLLAA